MQFSTRKSKVKRGVPLDGDRTMAIAFNCSGSGQIPNGEDTTVRFDTVVFDTSKAVDQATDATYFIVPETGLYSLSTQIGLSMEDPIVNVYVKIYFHDQESGDKLGALSGFNTSISSSGVWSLTKGHSISVVFGQARGHALGWAGTFSGHSVT